MSSILKQGDIIEGFDPGDLVEVVKVSAFGSKYLLEGITCGSDRRQIKRPVSSDDILKFKVIRGPEHTFQGEASIFLLGVEAERIRIAHQFDPLFAVNSSIVDPLPHQIEAVYRFLLPLPRIRFLLADDTGAGKTIMTGLLIKELLFRGVIQKMLIVTPGGLTRQWAEEELLEKFGLQPRLVNRASFEAEPSQFHRSDEGIFVASVDFLARNEACLNAAAQTSWDLIVVDEAHKLSAYEYGSKLDESERYRALKALSPRTDHLIFLTATPHRGRKDSFRRLLMLLDEDLFSKDEHVTSRVQQHPSDYVSDPSDKKIDKARNRFFLRRLKEEMVDWDGGKLFRPRHTKTVGYDLTPEEKELYDRVTSYVRSRRKEAKQKKNRNVELTLMVMQRRLASSIYAITRTLQNRLAALTEVLSILRDPGRSEAEKRRLLKGGPSSDDPFSFEEYEDLSESDREHIDKRIFRQVLTDDPEKVEAEREEVTGLLDLAKCLEQHHEEKFNQLLRVLDSSDVIRAEDEKLVIFTEHKDTLTNLAKRLSDKGYQVATIHGGMDPIERRQAQREFKLHAKIMVATDAAGEGINLQFCRYLINWDIPWNPNRLEQRMGRIHRYGQLDDVWVYNLVAQNTREGAVLAHVLKKLDVMRDQMGEDRVYDVIDDWLEDVPLFKLIEEAIDSKDQREAEAIGQKAESHLSKEKADRLVAIQKKTSLASRLDLRAARELRDASDERRLQPFFVERFFERAWLASGGTIQKDEHFPVWHLGSTPEALHSAAKRRRLILQEHYNTPFVFDKALVSVASRTKVPERTKLLGPGHPLFDALIEWAIDAARHSFAQGTVLVDPGAREPYRLWLTRSTIEDGRVENKKRKAHEQLSGISRDSSDHVIGVSPSVFLNFVPPPDSQNGLPIPELPPISPEDVQAWAYENITEPQLHACERDRIEECNLRREYLNTAFADLILELQDELNDLQQEQLLGDDNSEETERLEARIAELKRRKTDRLTEIDLMLNLTANLPEILTHALVIPEPTSIDPETQSEGGRFPMRRDDEVEAIAIGVAMSFETDRGWKPFDVSADGEHYDVRSEGPEGEKRFIEVKGRSGSGPIILTGPELDKLRQLGSRAWLYIVTDCKGSPQLHCIQDPIPKLNPAMLYKQVQFLVDEMDWRNAEKQP